MVMAMETASRVGQLGVAAPPGVTEVTAVVVLLIAQFMANMDTAIANLATPSIGATLHATGLGQQWVVAAYVLTSAMFMITAARLSTVLGDRNVFLGGLLAFTLERHAGDGVILGDGLRYAHSPNYVRSSLAVAGLTMSQFEEQSFRTESNVPVPGLVVVAAKA